jgi:hypothetical protein
MKSHYTQEIWWWVQDLSLGQALAMLKLPGASQMTRNVRRDQPLKQEVCCSSRIKNLRIVSLGRWYMEACSAVERKQ